MAWRGLLPFRKSSSAPSRGPVFAVEVLVALSLAFLVWLYFRTRDKATLDHMPIPVQIVLAPGVAEQYDLEVGGSSQVVVSFVGPSSRIHELRGLLQRGEVCVSIPFTVPPEHENDARYGDTVRVHAADVPVPPGVTALVAHRGNRIPVTLRRLVERRLPVRLNHPPDGRLKQLDEAPVEVRVRGPRDILDKVNSVPTVRYYPESLPGPASRQARIYSVRLALARELEGRPIRCVPDTVKLRLGLQPRPRFYQLKKIPIKFLCPLDFPYRPRFANGQSATLPLRVKASAVTPAQVTAYVDLTAGKVRPGSNVRPLKLQLPEDCVLAQEQPSPVEFELEPTVISPGWVVTEPP